MPIWTFGPLPSLSQLGLLQPGATLHTLQCIVFILALLYVSAPSVRPNICHVFWPGRRRQCLGLCLTLAQLVPPSSTNTIRDTNTQLQIHDSKNTQKQKNMRTNINTGGSDYLKLTLSVPLHIHSTQRLERMKFECFISTSQTMASAQINVVDM